ncbi:MAG: ABC transporter ATP-binding protein [Firmicutes bacterium]|nr:ABC transporter ATP-binding protein [Bacillota bacterium]MDY5531011.1 ABC transporter ATP-binding protein [Pumilibacteraceae bacterium]
MLKRFIAYYKPHRLLFTFDMLASLAVAAIAILYPMITRTMLNTYIPEQNIRMVAVCGAVLLGVYLLRMALSYFIQYYGHVMGVKMQAQMRSDMFNHLEKLPYSFFDNHETGKIMSRMTNDLMDISELAHHGPENLLISSISIIASFVYLCTIDWKLTLIVFACVPFLILITMILRKKMRSAFMRSRQSIGEINAALESSITGIRVTKAFNNSEIESKKFEEGNKKFVEARTDAYKAMGQFHSGTSFINDIFNVVVLIAGGFFLSKGYIQVGDYTAFTISVGLFIGPVMTLIGFMEQYQNGVTGFQRFLEVMDAEPEKDAEGAVDIDKTDGNISFVNVNYSYNEGEEVLKNLSLDVKKGEKFALVGPSGGGKTTICHLIPHFYDVNDGEILLDGVNIDKITRSSLRAQIGIVQQDVYLFNASVRDNILYGRPSATDEEVIEAAKRANIHEYVMSMPNGYDTVIGERGVRLSGGQKQRLSIARVFLKDPAILILDEATSALDNTTEILIQNALDELCMGRTTIVVAHRLSTIKNADRIAVVSGGQIIEQGTHEQLMAQNGAYADLYKLQFKNGQPLNASLDF